MFSYGSLVLMMQIGGVFLVVQLIDNFVVQPLVFSRSLKAHPVEILGYHFCGREPGRYTGHGVSYSSVHDR